MLGDRYDPTLIKFTNRVAELMESDLLLRSVDVKTEPHLLVRCVFGHLAAQGVGRYLKGPRTEDWAAWFLDDQAPMPSWASFHCWLYPYRRQVLWRDAVVTDLQNHKPCSYWLMKFFPLAFAIWNEPSVPFPVRAATISNFGPGDREGVVSIPTYPAAHEFSLEAPTENQIVVVGREAVSVHTRAPKGTLLKLSK